ncbi:MAG: sialidase family protein [Opitutales bacterium]
MLNDQFFAHLFSFFGTQSLLRAWMLLLLGLSGLLPAGCQHGPSVAPEQPGSPTERPEGRAVAAPNDEASQLAHRVREDFEAPLNANSGWAAEANTPARVTADQPFRLRFAVARSGRDAAPQRYQLEYRRNQGAWQPVLAENFPQPAKELAMEFASRPDSPPRDDWQIVQGQGAAMSREEAGEEGFLRVEAGADPLLALGRSEVRWEPSEFAAELRFPSAAGNQAGLVFAYADAENFRRLELDASGLARIIHVEGGETSVFARHDFGPLPDHFFELKLVLEGGALLVECNEVEQVLSKSYPLPAALSRSALYLPAGASVELQSLVIEGEPRSPRTSIIAAASFAHGAPTEKLLPASGLPFGGGAGISFAATTPESAAAEVHTEWEFPLVIRYFSDGAAVNESGDVFEYRLIDGDGVPLAAEHTARVTLSVPAGHLGGTFVETPMRLGPWQAGDGSLYFLMEPAETWNSLMAVKSEDGGRSWREKDGANRPETGDLEGFASRLVGDQIHMLHQTSDDVLYHVFRTADHPEHPDTWAIRDEWLASPEEPPTQVADLAVRSDGSVVAVYGGPEKIHYQIRSAAGEWSKVTIIDAGQSPDLSGPSLVLGGDDTVHLAYTGRDGSAWYRRILADGSMTERTQFAAGLGTTGEDVGSILPLVYLEASDEVVLLYRLATGQLWERRVAADGKWSDPIRITERKVVQNAVDAEQVGADAIAFGESVQLLFIEERTGHLFHTTRAGGGSWSEPVCVIDDKTVQWVRGALVENADGRPAYGFVFDGGSDGGSGKNQYHELILQND